MHISALCMHLCWEYDKLQQFITTCMMQVACECNSFESILVCCTTSPGGCKRGVWCSLVTAIYFFHIHLLCTHMFLGLCTYVCTGRRVEELCTCICFYVCVNSEPGDGSSWMIHDCNMIVYHECQLVSLGRSICFKWVSNGVDDCLTTMLCRSCFSTCV